MSTLSYTVPTVGNNNSTEDPIIRTALSDIKTAYNTDHTSGGHALSLLTSGSSAQIIVCNGSGVPTYVAATGDVTISNAGVTAIGSGVIVDADVNASAAIAGSKLDTTDGRLKQSTGVHASGGNLTLTTSAQDVPSATSGSFTCDVASYALVTTVFDFEINDVPTGGTAEEVICAGLLNVDGANETPVAVAKLRFHSSAAAIETRVTATQVHRIALTAASHTLKLQAVKFDIAGTPAAVCNSGNTRFIYQLVAQ